MVAAGPAIPVEQARFGPPLVNTVSACLILGVSRATIYRWMALGLVKWVRLPSGHRRIYRDSLLREPERA